MVFGFWGLWIWRLIFCARLQVYKGIRALGPMVLEAKVRLRKQSLRASGSGG